MLRFCNVKNGLMLTKRNLIRAEEFANVETKILRYTRAGIWTRSKNGIRKYSVCAFSEVKQRMELRRGMRYPGSPASLAHYCN